MENTNKLDNNIGVINARYKKYYCTCGHIGEWKSYYLRWRFECEQCNNGKFIYTTVLNKTTIGSYYANNTFTLEKLTDEQVKIIISEECIIFDDENSVRTGREEKVYTYDYTKAQLLNSKGRKIEITKIKSIHTKDLMDAIVKNYNDTHKYKINIQNEWYSDRPFRAFEKCLLNINLTVLQDYGMLDILYKHNNTTDKINTKGNNVRDITGLSKSVIEYITDTTSKMAQCDANCRDHRYEAAIKIKEIYPDIKSDVLLAIAKATEEIFFIIRANREEDAMDVPNNMGDWYRPNFDYTWNKFDETAQNIAILVKNQYNIKSLTRYISTIEEYQGIEHLEAILKLKDYSQMNVDMEQNYEKYPRSLVLAHDLTARNFKYVANEVEQKKIRERYETNKWLEYESDGKCILLPKCADDLITEGKQLHHCVGSYVKRVANGQSIILFGRYSNSKNESEVTIEVNSGSITQKRGLSDKRISSEWLKFIRKWASVKELRL